MKVFYIIFFLLVTVHAACAQQSKKLLQLRNKIAYIASDAKGTVGVAISCIEDNDTVTYNGNAKLVLQSVMKFPIAITVLHLIDEGKFNLNQLIHITEEDLPKNYSPLRDKYPKGNINMPLSELLSYMVSLSDNNVCDILLNKVTHKQEVESYMHSLGINDIAIGASESEMYANWQAQYSDWSTPVSLLHLMQITYKGQVLSKVGHDFLWKIMTETSNAQQRIKGLLPAQTIVAHKSGTSSTNNAGLSPATNDIGIINLPNGKHLAVVVLVCDAMADKATRELVIARISKAAYDTYTAK